MSLQKAPHTVHRLVPQAGEIFACPQGIVFVHANKMWQQGFFGKGIKIAIIDSGIMDHPNLTVSYRYSFVGPATDPHGTHVAGTAGARPQPGVGGIYGIAPLGELYDLQILNANGGSDTDFFKAVQMAVDKKVHVINCSFGVDQYSATMEQAVKLAWSNGIAIVCASGNGGPNTVFYPALFPETISVGDFDSVAGKLNSSSTTNTGVDVAAPGTKILSTVDKGQYALYTGTSMAAPHISGMMALYMEYLLNTKYANVINKDEKVFRQKLVKDASQMLYTNVIDVGPKGKDIQTGYGVEQYIPGPNDLKYLSQTTRYYVVDSIPLNDKS